MQPPKPILTLIIYVGLRIAKHRTIASRSTSLRYTSTSARTVEGLSVASVADHGDGSRYGVYVLDTLE